jgi:hypothetical protein
MRQVHGHSRLVRKTVATAAGSPDASTFLFDEESVRSLRIHYVALAAAGAYPLDSTLDSWKGSPSPQSPGCEVSSVHREKLSAVKCFLVGKTPMEAVLRHGTVLETPFREYWHVDPVIDFTPRLTISPLSA